MLLSVFLARSVVLANKRGEGVICDAFEISMYPIKWNL